MLSAYGDGFWVLGDISSILKFSKSYRSLNTETTDVLWDATRGAIMAVLWTEAYCLPKRYQTLRGYLQECQHDDHKINQSAIWRLSCLLFESCCFFIWCAWLFIDTSWCVWKATDKMSAGSNAGGVLPPEVRMSYLF